MTDQTEVQKPSGRPKPGERKLQILHCPESRCGKNSGSCQCGKQRGQGGARFAVDRGSPAGHSGPCCHLPGSEEAHVLPTGKRKEVMGKVAELAGGRKLIFTC